MNILSKFAVYSSVALITFAATNTNVNLNKISKVDSLHQAISYGVLPAEAAQTQIETRYALGYRLKTLKRRGAPKVPPKDIFETIRRILQDESVPAPQNFKFVSPNSAKVEWNNASRTCDAVGGKLIWFGGEKSCI